MPYVDPDYAVSGDPASSDAYNIVVDDVKDHEDRLVGQEYQAVLVKRVTNQTINTASWTEANFTSEDIDLGGWFSGSGTDVIVPANAIPADLTTIAVRISMYARFNTNGTGTRRCRIAVNGSASDNFFQGASLSSDPSTVSGFDLVVVAAADVITLEVYQDSGGSLALTGARLLVERGGGVA